MTTENQSKSGAFWPLVLGAAAIAFGGFVPLPGVNYDALLELLGDSGSWDLSVGPIGNSVGTLVLAYSFALGSKRTWAWRAALVFYLACALVQGLGIAFWLEGLNGAGGWGGLGGSALDVVMFPSWGFRLMVMLAYAAGASILWFISRSIDATRRATGALFLLLVRVLIDQLGVFSTHGDGVARGELNLIQVIPWLAMPLSIVIVAVVLYRRPNVKWPVMLWRWRLQSHIDVVALVAISTLPGGLAQLTSLIGVEPLWVDLFDVVLALGFGISASVWWWKLATENDTDKPTKLLVAVSASALLLVAAGFVGFVQGGGIERLTTPLPLEGDQAFTLVLDAETQFQPEDAETMAALLEELGASVEVTAASERSITLDVRDAIGRESVLQVLTPTNFLLSGVLDIQQNAPPEVLRRGTPSRYQSAYISGECVAFEGLPGASNQTGGLADQFRQRCRFAVLPGYEANECNLYCIGNEPVLTSGDIQEALVTAVNEYDNRPVVSIVLTDDAALRFENYTADHIQEAIAIEVNGVLESAPIVQSRIGGGRLQVTLGQDGDFTTMIQEAERLAAGLRPGGIQTPWRLRSE